MRRLLAPVAALAAVLLVPSAALAAVAPTLTLVGQPVRNSLPSFTWNDVRVLPLAMTYRVYRAPGDCAIAGPGVSVSGDLSATTLSFTDTLLVGDAVYCYYVTADDGAPPEEPSIRITVTYDATAPSVPVVAQTGGSGCPPDAFTLISATASDNLTGVTISILTGELFPFPPPGNFYDLVSPTVIATDGAGNATPLVIQGRILDPTGPGPVSLEVTTDPGQQKASLSWDLVAADGAPVQYRLQTKGPQGPSATQYGLTSPVVQQGLQVDATYEFTLDATDACGRTTSSVRLVRLNDSTPPTMPIVAGPSFDAGTHSVKLSWVASMDNIQVDHYVVLRDGVPLGATDATTFVDVAPPQHSGLSYVVRAVDTNGNSTASAPAPITTPDWTPPTAPVVAKPTVKGSTVTLQWPAAADNVGVVGYDVFRDGDLKPKGSMTAAKRSFQDLDVPPGVHTWRVRSRDDAGLTATSGPVTATVPKAARSRASVVALRMVGGGSGAARYSLEARGRLLVDVRVVGSVKKPKLRIYVSSGRGRVTVWRGTPGSSAPRLRLGSALVRHGFVTINLNRTFYSGRSRLVLIAGGRVVIAGKGAHRPSMKAG